MKILVVDDNESNRYQLQALLSGNGYQVVTAVQGAEALEIGLRDPPDLIISDILMPVMDGYTLCRIWMQDERLRDIPFVFYTATYTDEREFALSLGARKFIVKPEEPDDFIRHIHEIIRQMENGAFTPSESASAISDQFSGEAPGEDTSFLRQYNDVLIRKLEDKLAQLEQSRHELERDVAERKRVERTVLDRESELRLIMDAAPALISYVGVDLRYRRVNKSYERWFGLAAEQMQGRCVRDLMGESAWRSIRPYVDRVLAGETVSFEQEIAFGQDDKRITSIKRGVERKEPHPCNLKRGSGPIKAKEVSIRLPSCHFLHSSGVFRCPKREIPFQTWIPPGSRILRCAMSSRAFST